MQRILELLSLIAMSALLAACGLRIPDPAPYLARCDEFRRPAPEGAVTGVFFMTSRMPDCRKQRLDFPGIRYPELHFGISDPSPIPIEGWDKPSSFLLAQADWEAALQRDVRAGGKGRVLVYVHGYLNDFDDVLQRADILRGQYDRRVPTIAVSWPSRNRPHGYSYDEDSIEWSQDHLDTLLARLAETSEEITLIGHSMGARAAVRAVERLDLEDPAKGRKINRIVLASPDMDRDQMLRENGTLSRMLSRQEDRKVLIYVSRRDFALRLSRDTHGYSRLGSSDCGYDVVYRRRTLTDCHLTTPNERLAIVDTSAADAEYGKLIRHNDFVKSCAVRADLRAFLRGQAPPAWRQSVTRPGETLLGYRIAPELVDANACP
jgi:esterase/lipase superfamily enzyme